MSEIHSKNMSYFIPLFLGQTFDLSVQIFCQTVLLEVGIIPK